MELPGGLQDFADFTLNKSVGLGIRWLSPIGPIRFDVASALKLKLGNNLVAMFNTPVSKMRYCPFIPAKTPAISGVLSKFNDFTFNPATKQFHIRAFF